MPETNGVKVSTIGSVNPRDNFSKHYFVGGNTFMLDIWISSIKHLFAENQKYLFGSQGNRI